jgi:ankyrin repeat protein
MINADYNKELDKIYTNTNKIFQLIKMQDWINLEKTIINIDMDYNIKDNSNTWLLEYLIMFNQYDILKILLTKNIRIDIIDDNNRSILYSVIKFSYIPILKLLLDKDKEIIGKSILEIKDNEHNIPLFYAIKYFNIEAIEIILKYQNNIFTKNIEGENALHISVKTLNLDIFKIILNKINDINIKKNNGETCLHLAIKYKCYDIIKYILTKFAVETKVLDFNLTETKYNFSCIHYIFLSFDLELIYIFKDFFTNFNLNIQDKSGNIFLHYFINNIMENDKDLKNEDIEFIIQEIIKLNVNYNLYNIDRNTPCHILLLNLDFFKNKYNILINTILKKTNLNIQNKNGESCFFLLIKNNYWINVYNILNKKKLDIFIINEKKNTVFDYISSSDMNKFIELVTNSYLYLLNETDYNVKWIDYWDNRCKKNINLTELNETEKDLIQNIKLDNNKTLCFNLISDKLKNFIETFKKDKKIYDIYSYPIHTKYPKLIDKYPDVVIPTFTGSTIDVFSGLIYLNTKFIKNTISSLKLININEPILQCHKNICEITNFEIIWKNYQLFLPKFNDLKRILINYDKNIRFFIIPIGIELSNNDYSYGHANILIFDFLTMEVERFEPHGAESPYGFDYNPKLLDNTLKNKIDIENLGFKYIIPNDYLQKIGFQIKEIYELKSDYIGDPNGFCVAWCIWWADIRLTNPSIDRVKLVKLLSKQIVNDEYSYKKLIRNYSNVITKIRDKIFLKVGININDWINDNINVEQKLLLEKTLKIEIEKFY